MIEGDSRLVKGCQAKYSKYAICCWAARVAKEFKHGHDAGFYYYIDDKIDIDSGHLSGNLIIRLNMGASYIEAHLGRKVIVLQTHGRKWHQPFILRPGRWIDYLQSLDEKVTACKKEEQLKNQKQHQRAMNERYAAIDDKLLFVE